MRTIQSAVALVSSMLPHVGGPASSHQVEIEVYPDEAMEIMHGVGLWVFEMMIFILIVVFKS